MIIEEKKKYVDFGTLNAGDTFWSEDRYYMKVEEYYGDGIDAIDLESGIIVEFCADEKVVPVNAKLVIE